MYSISLEFEAPSKSIARMDESFHIVFNSGEYFDFNYPFRAVVEKVVEQLESKGKQVRIDQLSEYEDHEDFISFRLSVDEESLSAYFEQSLGYLSLASDNNEILEFVKNACQGCTFDCVGYGVTDE